MLRLIELVCGAPDVTNITKALDSQIQNQNLQSASCVRALASFVRTTNKGSNEIYIVNQHNSPNTMQEIGRLRELTFAMAGGGTGEQVDIDDYDTSENCYEQLIVYSPEYEEITGGYRFIDCSKVLDTKPLELSTRHYFNFSENFSRTFCLSLSN